MKRFMIFAYSDIIDATHPNGKGGMSDYVGSTNTLFEGFPLALKWKRDAYGVEAIDLLFNTFHVKRRAGNTDKWDAWVEDKDGTAKLREIEPLSMLKPEYGEAATLADRQQKTLIDETLKTAVAAADAPSPDRLDRAMNYVFGPVRNAQAEAPSPDGVLKMTYGQNRIYCGPAEVASVERLVKKNMFWRKRELAYECETSYGVYRMVGSAYAPDKYKLSFKANGADNATFLSTSEGIEALKKYALSHHANRVFADIKFEDSPKIKVVQTDEPLPPSVNMGENARFGVAIKNSVPVMLVFQNIGINKNCLTDTGLYTIVPQASTNLSTGEMMEQSFALWFNPKVTVGNKAELIRHSIESLDEAMRLVTEHYAKN